VGNLWATSGLGAAAVVSTTSSHGTIFYRGSTAAFDALVGRLASHAQPGRGLVRALVLAAGLWCPRCDERHMHMQGKARLQGDMAKLMASQQGGRNPAPQQAIQGITK
jgi:hypothetical protein